MTAEVQNTVLNEDDITRTLTRIAHEIVEGHPDPSGLVIVGIHRRGAVLASRLSAKLSELLDREIPLGDLDIAFYRDDLDTRRDYPEVNSTHLEGVKIDGSSIVLVDDVLFTGRTVRAAIEAIFDYGRPSRVQLAVLVDRGHRDLPFRADYVGKNLPTAIAERVAVLVAELDGKDAVEIRRPVDMEKS